ncbi:TPA: hypothetical protein EYP12_04715 [Candidatus Bipolaricaulota bacterium]|nr:hypothetical protein [Candidatus Bipolaricaulota bacterium]
MERLVILGIVLLCLCGPSALALQGQEGGQAQGQQEMEIIDRVLEFIYSVAHGIGQLVVRAVQLILPQTEGVLDPLIDPIGVLALLTLFLGLYELAKRITWIIVIVGWALIIIRIVLVVLEVGEVPPAG